LPIRSPTLPARYTSLIVDQARTAGPRGAVAIAKAGLDEDVCSRPGATISLAALDALLEAVEVASGRQDIGFEVGRRMRFASHDVLGVAMENCKTVDQLLRLAARHFDLITPPCVMEYRRDAEQGWLIFRPVAAMTPRVLRTLNEAHAVATHEHLRTIAGERLPPLDIYFSGEPPRHASRYDTLKNARVHFGALSLPEVHLALPAALLAERLPDGDQRAARLAERRMRERSPASADSGRWSEWVSMILNEAVDVQPTQEKLASLLNVTPRTLNNHLVREGQSFRALSNRIRHERACRALIETSKPISEIAYELGYADVANFSHAFRAMRGNSPRTFRRGEGRV
jgi:AraC-like DNA-binding protein